MLRSVNAATCYRILTNTRRICGVTMERINIIVKCTQSSVRFFTEGKKYSGFIKNGCFAFILQDDLVSDFDDADAWRLVQYFPSNNEYFLQGHFKTRFKVVEK